MQVRVLVLVLGRGLVPRSHQLLRRLRSRTRDVAVPVGFCMSTRVLWGLLQNNEQTLQCCCLPRGQTHPRNGRQRGQRHSHVCAHVDHVELG